MSTLGQRRKGSRRGASLPSGSGLGTKGSKVGASSASRSAKKSTKSVRQGEDEEQAISDSRRDESLTSEDQEHFSSRDIQELIMKKVEEFLETFNRKDSDASLQQLVPALTKALTTAVSVAVSEAVKEISRSVQETLSRQLRQAPTTNERRLLSAVTSLTYENDRLQQYTRRESVRIHGIKSATGETVEEVEQKALEVFSAVGAKIEPADLAAVHRAGKEKRGSRPILVKFVSRRKRREVMEKKKILRENDQHRGIYINDDLTQIGRAHV